MNQTMKDIQQRNPINNESNQQADPLPDLPVADEQADATKGGDLTFDKQGRLLIGTEGGVW